MNFRHVIRDSIHGNIAFSSLERSVIDSAFYQRLRDISQLGFLSYVFPCARHARFEHGIAVMHLAGRMASALAGNVRRCIESADEAGITLPDSLRKAGGLVPGLEDENNIVRLRLAGLLHDAGHSVFSHASEGFTRRLSADDFIAAASDVKLKKYFEGKKSSGEKPSHEWVGHLFLNHLFSGDIKDRTVLIDDVHSILDADWIPSETSRLKPGGLWLLLHSVISGEVDADRMDYLLRDSYAAGVNYGVYDLERLLAHLVFHVTEQGPKLAVNLSGLQSFEHYLIGRYQMYMQIYTHKTNAAFEMMLDKLGEICSLKTPLTPDEFLKFTEAGFAGWVRSSQGYKEAANEAESLLSAITLKRQPWKSVWQGGTVDDEKEVKHFERWREQAEKSPLKNDMIFFEAHRSLTRLAPTVEAAGSGELKVLVKDTLTKKIEMKDIFEYSHLLVAFRKKIALRRVYARPEKKEEVLKFLRSL